MTSSDDEPELDGDDPADASGGTEVARFPGPGCTTQPIVGEVTTRWVTIGSTYPHGASTAWMKVGSSEGAYYGIALLGPAGWSGSGQKFVQNSWSFTWAELSEFRSYRVLVKYQKYGTACSPQPAQYSWRPIQEVDGTGSSLNLTRPDWSHCRDVAFGKWERDRTDGEEYQFGGAVKLKSMLGVDLSIKRSYSSNQYLTYRIQGDQPKRMCGNNDEPALAGKVMERAG